MTQDISTLSLVAAGLYAVVAVACAFAAAYARSKQQARWNTVWWAAIAALFAGLVAMRLFDVEDQLRSALRAAMQARGEYGGRRELQSVIAAGLLLLAGLVMAGVFRTTRGIRGRRNFAVLASIAASGTMVALVGLRIVSFHWVDIVLNGPLKLNWIGDIGSSFVVLGAALFYMRLVRARR